MRLRSWFSSSERSRRVLRRFERARARPWIYALRDACGLAAAGAAGGALFRDIDFVIVGVALGLVALPVLAFGYSSGLRERRWKRRRDDSEGLAQQSAGRQVLTTLRLLGGAVVPAVVVLVVAAALFDGVLAYRFGQSRHEVNRAISALHYPPSVTVCGVAVDAECAATAAQRSGRTVAWVPSSGRVRAVNIVVLRRSSDPIPLPAGRVFEHLSYGDVGVEVMTSPGPPVGRSKAVRRVTVSGVQATMFEDDAPDVSIEWSLNGETYRIYAGILLGSRAETRRAALAVAASIRYEQPGP